MATTSCSTYSYGIKYVRWHTGAKDCGVAFLASQLGLLVSLWKAMQILIRTTKYLMQIRWQIANSLKKLTNFNFIYYTSVSLHLTQQIANNPFTLAQIRC